MKIKRAWYVNHTLRLMVLSHSILRVAAEFPPGPWTKCKDRGEALACSCLRGYDQAETKA